MAVGGLYLLVKPNGAKPKRLRLDNGPRVDQSGTGAMGSEKLDRAALHPAWQADSECAHRTLQSNYAYRVARSLRLQQHE